MKNATRHPGMILRFSGGVASRAVTGVARLVGAGLLVTIGLIHLVLAPQYMQQATYVGVSFYLTCAVAWVTAAAIVVGVRYAWLAGGVTAAGAFAALLASVTVGLPAFQESLAAPWAYLSLLLEGAFVMIYAVLALARRSAALAPGRTSS